MSREFEADREIDMTPIIAHLQSVGAQEIAEVVKFGVVRLQVSADHIRKGLRLMVTRHILRLNEDMKLEATTLPPRPRFDLKAARDYEESLRKGGVLKAALDEVERLQGVLRKIASGYDDGVMARHYDSNEAAEIAQAALR